MAALDYLRTHATEFDDLPDEWVNKKISSASLIIDVSSLDDERAALCTGLYAAHLLWLERYSGGGHRGAVISEKDKDLSRTYQPVKNTDTFLGQSPYGLLYNEINGGISSPSIITRIGTCP